MAITVTINGTETDSGLLVAPMGNTVFPARIGLRSDNGAEETVEIRVSGGGAGIELEQSSLQVGAEETFVSVHATSPSMARDDTMLRILCEDAMEATLSLTAVNNPRIFFDGRFEARFSTGRGPYNEPRGEGGWMWALEDEPDFVPEDAVPDRIDKKPVGRTVRFHNPAINRPHIDPIGVTVKSIIATVNGVDETFTEGDPVIGTDIRLGDDTYFAGNKPVSAADSAAGRLPEEQHDDGFQPMGNFEFHLGADAFSGTSRVGPFVPGTTESARPRDPDFRPYGGGLKSLNAAERAAYPFPGLRRFGEQRVGQLLPDYEVLKDAGNTDTVEFRNLQTRISHLISNVNSALRDQILAEHSADGMQVLGGNPSFTWGNKEEYRGTINEELNIDAAQSPLLAYFSHFESFQFLCVFFNFHTDEDRGGCYGSVDPSSPPPVLG